MYTNVGQQGDQLILPESPETSLPKRPADSGWVRLTNLLSSISPLTSLGFFTLCLTSTFPNISLTYFNIFHRPTTPSLDPANFKSVSPPLLTRLSPHRQTSHPIQIDRLSSFETPKEKRRKCFRNPTASLRRARFPKRRLTPRSCLGHGVSGEARVSEFED